MRLISGLYDVMVKMVMAKMVKKVLVNMVLVNMVKVIQSPQVHEGDCYLLALDLLQQHAATLGAAAIVVTCLMVSSMHGQGHGHSHGYGHSYDGKARTHWC